MNDNNTNMNPQGIQCPRCKEFIPCSASEILKASSIICPKCGLKITIDREKQLTEKKKFR